MKIVHVIGRRNHGKTTLVEDVLRELVGRGLRVGTIKHCGHEHELDVRGKDSHRHRGAGAETVAVLTPSRLSVHSPRPPGSFYEQLEATFQGCDLVIVEGDARGPGPKVEVWRGEMGGAPLAEEVDGVVAIVSDDAPDTTRPVWSRRDLVRIADGLGAAALPVES